jgi:hypothetical protein
MTISRNLSILAENVNTSGQVSLTTGVSGATPIANGGTGQTTRQDAIDALAGAVTSGSYLRGNGTDVVMSTIQATDVPTLNQNTTGTASNVTGTVAVANGGTGRASTTAYAVICGGTTSTSAEQSIADVGTAGQVLTSNGAGALPTFQAAGGSSFPAGTVMLFVQTSAPTGWTKDTTNNNNKALRVVTGTASTGGSVAFTTAFASQSVAGSVSVSGGSVSATTLSTSQIPSHQHSLGLWRPNVPDVFQGGYTTPGNRSCPWFGTGGPSSNPYLGYSENAGGGGSHDHGFTAPTASFSGTAINLAVQYVDVIVATKN